jgi:replicative DNA helicase
LPRQVLQNEKDIMSSVRNAPGPDAQAAQAAQDRQVAALKLPPHSIEAEQSLIGGLLLDNSTWDRVGDQVNESDFYRDDHRRIFRHIAS